MTSMLRKNDPTINRAAIGPIRIGLGPSHLKTLQAGQPLLVQIGDLTIELYPREEILGTCTVRFTQLRSAFLEWPEKQRDRCLQTIKWYLDSGAGFVDARSGA